MKDWKIMKSFYECSLFSEEKDVEENFLVSQKELLLKEQVSLENYKFESINVSYRCSWFQQDNWNSSLPTLLIPTKDNRGLVEYTFKNLKDKGMLEICNVILIDDRSTEDLKGVSDTFGVSYLRVDNDKGFNFSMLNNIAAWICHKKGVENIVLWNSDLWCEKRQWFSELLERHKSNGNSITGTKLLYPSVEMSYNKSEDTENIKKHFPQMIGGHWRQKVQFGGSMYHPNGFPDHLGRFADKSDERVNVDRSSVPFITGAFQIINLSHFVSSGGLNPSLSRNFQDVELCERMAKFGKVAYYGKDLFFYHDESPTLMKEGKYNHQMTSDHILFKKIQEQ